MIRPGAPFNQELSVVNRKKGWDIRIGMFVVVGVEWDMLRHLVATVSDPGAVLAISEVYVRPTVVLGLPGLACSDFTLILIRSVERPPSDHNPYAINAHASKKPILRTVITRNSVVGM